MKLRELRDHAVALGFTPQEQVRWLSPPELWRTAVKVGLSSVFADYADRREVQAALPARLIEVPEDAEGGLWLDFVADTGDGFDPTFTVATLLAADRLEVDPAHAGEHGPPGPALQLPRGRLLVLGGDEVYPTPSATAYEDRTKGPYRAAFPAPPPGAHGSGSQDPGSQDPGADVPGRRPLMVALPGNHDWYDGLTAFLRMFTQQRAVGGWRTEQTRSYFAVRLPRQWWLVGVDTQLGTYIDDPQVRYFRRHLSERLRPGDAVIVCAPTPTWVHTGEGEADAFNAMHFFERDVVRRYRRPDGSWQQTGAAVRLWITGDRHHYARYAEDLPPGRPAGAPRQLVTCGLGGAYLLDTHRLPARLELPSPQSRMAHAAEPRAFSLRARWPSAERSRRLVAGLFAGPPRGLPFRNPGLWPLAGGIQSLLMLVLASILGQEHGTNPAIAVRTVAPGDVGGLLGQAAVWLGALLLIATALPLLRAHRPHLPPRWVGAALLQLLVGFAALDAMVALPWPETMPDWAVLGLAMLVTAVVAGLVACYVLGLSIALARSRFVQGWQLSAQAIEDFKGFVRIRLDAQGRLTLYPVVVDTVCHDWDLMPTTVPGMVRPVAAGGLPRPYLAEPPIVIDRDPAP